MSQNLTNVIILLVIVSVVAFLIWRGRKLEQDRMRAILDHKDEWGEDTCTWLIKNKFNLKDPRTKQIMDQYKTWGPATCLRVLLKRVAIGDEKAMVLYAFGQPSNMDEKTITAKDEKVRWIYGTPRKGATYVWFKNGIVTKIKS